MNILFRCDGSVEIGMGHVVRCLALADELKENHNCNIHFAMRTSLLGKNMVKESFPVIQSYEKEFNYEDWLTDCIKKTEAEILIMDMRDGLTRKQLKQIKKMTGVRVVTIDDPGDKRLESDLAFYPPVPQLENLSWDGFNGDLFVGWEYVILRKEFSKKYLKPNNIILNILVSMGGTDENNMIGVVIDALNLVDEKFKAIIIVGFGYLHMDQLNKSLVGVRFEFELYQNPKNIAEIMSQTDFAIISFGQTAYELAALNIPALYLSLTSDHQESSKLFFNEGVGVSFGVFSKKKKEKQKLVESLRLHIVEKQMVKEEISNHAYLLNISKINKISTLIMEKNVYA